MKKISLISIIIMLLANGSAWAQLSLGGTGAVFANTDQSADTIITMFKEGEGIFYGPFIELGMKNFAIGAAFNWSYYVTDYINPNTEMIDYDLSGYLQGHLFSYKAFIDPFFEIGIGKIATDYAKSSEDNDPSNPLRATTYFQAGGGLGLNFGALGFFAKALYMIPTGDPVVATIPGYASYNLEAYPLKPLKIFLGAKIIL